MVNKPSSSTSISSSFVDISTPVILTLPNASSVDSDNSKCIKPLDLLIKSNTNSSNLPFVFKTNDSPSFNVTSSSKNLSLSFLFSSKLGSSKLGSSLVLSKSFPPLLTAISSTFLSVILLHVLPFSGSSFFCSSSLATCITKLLLSSNDILVKNILLPKYSLFLSMLSI